MKNILVLLAALALSGTALAGAECDPEVTLVTPAGTYYVDSDTCQPDCFFDLWIYEESDGEPGCSKGDTIVF